MAIAFVMVFASTIPLFVITFFICANLAHLIYLYRWKPIVNKFSNVETWLSELSVIYICVFSLVLGAFD